MTIIVGVDFRSTLGYVTDPNSNYTFSNGSEAYPTSFNGTNIGKEAGTLGGQVNRDTGVDVRLAGIAYVDSGDFLTYRVDLPEAGTYSIQFALGDHDNSRVCKVEIFDDVTSLLVVSGTTAADDNYFAANGVEYTTAATWATANVVNGGGVAQTSLTFASTICRFKFGGIASLVSWTHLFVSGPTGAPIVPARKDLAFTKSIPSVAVNTYMYPDADVTDGGWLNQAGSATNLFASIDEATVSDADYIKSEINPASDMCEINLSNPPVPVAEPFEVLYRYKKTGTGTIDLVVSLVEGTTIRKTWTHTNISSSFVTTTQTLSSGEFASIVNSSNLRLRFTANKV